MTKLVKTDETTASIPVILFSSLDIGELQPGLGIDIRNNLLEIQDDDQLVFLLDNADGDTLLGAGDRHWGTIITGLTWRRSRRS